MTAVGSLGRSFASPNLAADISAGLYVPRVEPLEGPLGSFSFFTRLLKNPLRILPAATYEEDIVWADRAKRSVCWITEPGLIKTVLLDQRDVFERTSVTQRLLGPLLGNGVLTADGADWKWQRQTAAPVFRHQDLLSFVPVMAEAAERLLADWRQDHGATRNIDRDMTLVTFDVISHTLLPGGQSHVAPLIGRANVDYQKPLGWQMAYANFGIPAWVPHPGWLTMQMARRQLRSAVASLVAERRATPSAKDDLLQRLANAKNPETGAQMPDQLLIDNLLTFFMAGHETTAKALTWTLYLLARAPHWGQRIAEEVRRVAGDGPLRPEHIDKLVITTQVLKESMRLYPPAPIMSRQASVDSELAGMPIKTGTQVIIPIYAIQRHRRRWTNPDHFEPGRFAPELEAQIPRYQYMPFGAGPRICIGMAFALIEGIAILATLARAARFACEPGLDPEPISRVTLRPAGGMPLSVHVR
ncbi:MAG TPA: cytochrome P450 [Hyphomicrobiaceae bacterium]|jgi:cytochrome P450|nr:cytochrome P450 [Hyphomicrobiaceae bacterium]